MTAMDRIAAARRQAEELQLDTVVGRLAALAWGEPSRPPLLAVHGWLDNAASFTPLAAQLHSHRLVAIDLPGHGGSAHRPAGCHYHFIDYVPVIPAAADALGWDRFAVVGHSLGANVGALVAAVLPDRIAALAMIDGIGPLSEPPDRQPGRMREALERVLSGAAANRRTYPELEALVAARLAAGRLEHQSARLLVERNVQPLEGGYCWRTDPRLRWPSPLYMSEEQVLAFLSQITVPSLLIVAGDGVLAGRPTTARRLAAIPGLRVVELAGRHHLHMDDPKPVAEALGDFLATAAGD